MRLLVSDVGMADSLLELEISRPDALYDRLDAFDAWPDTPFDAILADERIGPADPGRADAGEDPRVGTDRFWAFRWTVQVASSARRRW
jgi:hypothetical protein